MAGAKYKIVFEMMIKKYKNEFMEFKKIHDLYLKEPKKTKAEFNAQGQDILEIIHRYENTLCGHSENSGYGKFTSGLTDKFWQEIRSLFPKIDEVGLK